jgi:hypothetical protein
MVKEAWDPEPEKRPDMKRVATLICGDLIEVSDGDETVPGIGLDKAHDQSVMTKFPLAVREKSCRLET